LDFIENLDLEKLIIFDYTTTKFAKNEKNIIKIKPFFGEEDDIEFLNILQSVERIQREKLKPKYDQNGLVLKTEELMNFTFRDIKSC
jgi:TFIIF-interacting CTD phosphatase-like protein